MLILLFYIVLGMISSFLLTFYTTPLLIRAMGNRNIVGTDMNKYDKRKIPELGGIGVWFGFCFGMITLIFLTSYVGLIQLDLISLLASFSTILMISLIGVFDDLIGWKTGIRQWQHALLPMFAALPLMAINIDNPAIILPFLGLVDFGIVYSAILVPLGITGAANATNMLGGLNGLEAGLGVIITLTLGTIAISYGRPEAAILCFLMLAALLAFLIFNWYPAKIFGGDSLTLMIGATIGAASIIGDLEKIGLLLLFIYFLELIIKAKHRFKSECFGIPQENGTLKANPKGGSLTHLVMKIGNFTEKQVVIILLGAQLIISLAIISASVLKIIYI